MGEFNSAVLTARGMELLNRCQTEKKRMEFSRAALGNGVYAESDDLMALTSLKAERQSFPFVLKQVVNRTNSKLKFIATNHDETQTLTEGYPVREVGVYAIDPDDPDGEEILYAVALAVPGHTDWMPSYNDLLPTTMTITIQIEVSNAETVIITGGGGAYASAEDFEELKDAFDNLEMTAEAISYDNSGSRLLGENAQDAIDELARQANLAQSQLMAVAIATTILQGAAIAGMSGNVTVDAFSDANGVTLLAGMFDNQNHRLYA